MSIHGFNQVYIDNAGTAEKWDSNGNGAGKVTLYDASGTEIGQETNPLIVGPDYLVGRGTSAAPDPNSDWESNSATAPVSGDYDIRDTSAHDISWPMLASGYTKCSFAIYGTSYDQSVTLLVYGSHGTSANKLSGGAAELASITLPASTCRATFAAGAVGQGGNTGGATASTTDLYEVTALDQPFSYIMLRLTAGVTPTAGSFVVTVNRIR